ncbi:MAG: radical SAM-associated putative lipoprotein [Alistipes sp.]|nr:radical SAM-associated putative lipoprotein [Alistipes sp.]
MRYRCDSLKVILINFLLILLGFNMTRCDSKDEYGSPSARYKIRGRTVDQTSGEPIAALRTVFYDRTSDGKVYGIDTLYTDSNGEFNFDKLFSTFRLDEIYLKIEDVDGGDNGSYEEMDTVLDLTGVGFKNGSGQWYRGEAAVDLGEIGMKPWESFEN